MAGVLSDMAQVALGWAIAFFAIAGWGHLTHRLCGAFALNVELWLEHFWLGMVAVLAFLQIWNLFLPVDWKASLVVALVGLAATVSRAVRGPLPALKLSRSQVVALLLCLPVLIRLAHQSLLPPSHYDSGLYHFNAIRWHMEYPLPPGLGNLHGRLAFNISYFLYVALLNVYPWFQHGHNIATSLCVAVISLQLGQWIRRLLAEPDKLDAPMLLRVCLAPVLFGTVGYSPLSGMTYHTLASPSPDVPLFIWGMLLFLKFVDYLFPRQVEPNDLYSPVWICVMGLGAATLKITMIVFVFIIIGITVAVWFRRAETRRRTFRHIALTLLAASLLILVPWSVRGIVLSGYVCYPSTFGAVEVDWKVPQAKASHMAQTISNWAKGEQAKLRPKWLEYWAAKYLAGPSLKWPLLTLAISCAALRFLSLRFRFDPKLLIPLLPALAAVLFWFSTAPNVRFLGSALWLLALWPTALALTLMSERVRLPSRGLFLAALVALALALSIIPVFRRSPHFRGRLEGFAPVPTASLTDYQTRSGLVLPIGAVSRQTWDAPLPTAPRPVPELELRGPSLAQGFRVRSRK